jgi:hypothetical protein
MIRGFAIGLGAGTQALTLMAGELIAGPPNELGEALLNGAGWAINLAVAEWAIRKGRSRYNWKNQQAERKRMSNVGTQRVERQG